MHVSQHRLSPRFQIKCVYSMHKVTFNSQYTQQLFKPFKGYLCTFHSTGSVLVSKSNVWIGNEVYLEFLPPQGGFPEIQIDGYIIITHQKYVGRRYPDHILTLCVWQAGIDRQVLGWTGGNFWLQVTEEDGCRYDAVQQVSELECARPSRGGWGLEESDELWTEKLAAHSFPWIKLSMNAPRCT